MFAYILRRLLEMVPVLLVVSLLVFGFIKLLPGDPARIYAGPDAPIEAVEAARQHLGLNDPLPQQYVNWLGGILRGDLGVTYRTQQPVLEVIRKGFMPTLWLALAGFVWSVALGLALGVTAALRLAGLDADERRGRRHFDAGILAWSAVDPVRRHAVRPLLGQRL